MFLYVVLYDRGLPGTFHWGLVPHDDVPICPVVVYHISDLDPTQPNKTGQWHLAHGVDNLQENVLVRGLVRITVAALPDVSAKDIAEFIEQYNALEGKSLSASQARAPWSSSRWVVRVIEDMAEAELVNVPARNLYSRILARGLTLSVREPRSGLLISDLR